MRQKYQYLCLFDNYLENSERKTTKSKIRYLNNDSIESYFIKVYRNKQVRKV